MKVCLTFALLVLVCLCIETKCSGNEDFGKGVRIKRSSGVPTWYDHFKDFWKDSWYKTKRDTEKVIGSLAHSFTSLLFKKPTHAVKIEREKVETPKPTETRYENEEEHGGSDYGKIPGGVFNSPPPAAEIHKNKTRADEGKENETHQESAKEHGNFDFAGRDAIRKIGALASKTGKKIGEFVSSTISTGLDVKNGTLLGGAIEKFKDNVRAIYPGTLWCGDGTKAKDHEELGRFNETDACCRQHDECPDNIPSDSKKYGLENTGLFTRSHCDCDIDFYNCLKEADSLVSKKIGFTYFTILGPQCFKEERIITACLKEEHGKCVEYELLDNNDRKYQWFDSPPF